MDRAQVCDGKGGFRLDVIAPEKIENKVLKACWRCGLEDCNKVHEQHHIEQFEARCPDKCGCQREGKNVGFVTDDCLQKAECYGWAAFWKCLKDAYEKKFKDDTKTKCDAPVNKLCRDILPILIKGGPPLDSKKYECDKHKIEVKPKD